jgi:toxin ParE1/3/4
VKVRLSGPARASLERITDYIAQRDPLAADQIATRLIDAAMSLAEFPRRYPLIEESAKPIHKMTVGNYLIIYQIQDQTIDVARIVHASTDWIRQF